MAMANGRNGSTHRASASGGSSTLDAGRDELSATEQIARDIFVELVTGPTKGGRNVEHFASEAFAAAGAFVREMESQRNQLN